MEDKKEIWKPLSGLEGFVEISSFGNFKRLARKGLPEFRYIKGNRGTISAKVGGKKVTGTVSMLVAQHFIPNPKNYKYVIHKNNDISDCNSDNLQWSECKQLYLNLKNRVGEVHKTSNGEYCEIIDYINSSNCTVQFEDGTILKNIRYRTVKDSKIRNLNFPHNRGLGCIGFGTYNSKEHRVAFNVWRSVLQRCYSKKHQKKCPSYIGCSVCEEWYNFQNFAKWYYENYNPETMKGWQLDKDFLLKGNKVYSPETCCLIPGEINSLKLFSKRNGKLPTGVYEVNNTFVSRINKKGKKYHIGTFKTILEALEVYKVEKEKYISQIAELYKYKIDNRIYQILIDYKVEIDESKFK